VSIRKEKWKSLLKGSQEKKTLLGLKQERERRFCQEDPFKSLLQPGPVYDDGNSFFWGRNSVSL